MCNCDCELTKQDRWDRVRREHAHELAERIRREAAVWGVDTVAGRHFLEAADLIDPLRALGSKNLHDCETSRCWSECHPQ